VTSAHAPTWREHLFNVRMAASSVRFVPRLPVERLEALFPGIDELEISLRHSVRDRALLYAEAYVLSLVTAYVQPVRIFEIGTATGQGTLLMARQAPEARIDTLDLGSDTPSLGRQAGEPPWQDLEAIGSAFRGTEYAARITQHFGDSARFDFAPFRGQVDLVFVDGAHTYDYVWSDSRNALAMLSERGVVIWDDCNYVCPGVSKMLLELRREGRPIYRVFGTRFAVLRSRP
jgi:predicted O-methyltransferase YrrM